MSHEVRVQIQEQFRRLSKDSIQLAWALGPLFDEKGKAKLNEWGFDSFGQWIMEDICNPDDPSRCYVSRAYAYELGNVGKLFYPHRKKIDELALSGKIGIRRLIELVQKHNQGTPIEMLEAHIEQGVPLPEEEEAKNASTDAEKFIPYRILVRQGDLKNVKLSIFLYALIQGHKTTDNAAADMILSELPALMSQNLGQYERFRHMIYDGTFECKFCGAIPTEPTIHHVVPVSEAHGYGPQVLLCRHCHYYKVQPHSRKYATKWGWDYDQILAEAKQMVAVHGKIINTGPYYVIQELDLTEDTGYSEIESSPQGDQRAHS